jgi:shikimate kinase
MKRVLLTGTSGTGKSTIAAALADRGYRAVDADYGGLSELVDAPAGELTGIGGGRDWVWRVDRIAALLDQPGDGPLFLAGCSPNQGRFYPRFDHVVLLTAPPAVVAHRLATRTNNPYGRAPDEVTRALELQRTVEPLLRRGAGLVVDTTNPVDDVVAAILNHVGS